VKTTVQTESMEAKEQPKSDSSRDPVAQNPRSDAGVDDQRRDPFATGNSVRPNLTPAQVFAVQLEIARAKIPGIENLVKRGFRSQYDVLQAQMEVRLIEGQIAGRIDILEDELEFLQARLFSRKAEAKQYHARAQCARQALELVSGLQARGAASKGELLKTEAASDEADGELDVKQAGVKEIEVLINQTSRQLERFRALLKTDAPKPENR